MKREKIIKLAQESGLHKRHIPENADEWWCFTSGIERFAAAIEAEKDETIAGQQARIETLSEVLFRYASRDDITHEAGVRDALSRTDDLSALNKAKAQVLKELAKKCLDEMESGGDLFSDGRNAGCAVCSSFADQMAQELRAQK